MGAKGVNNASDVKQVQDKLLELGFLAPEEHKQEQTILIINAKLKDEDKLKTNQILLTIKAIKAYEKAVLYAAKPTGLISKQGLIINYLNIHRKNPNQLEIELVRIWFRLKVT